MLIRKSENEMSRRLIMMIMIYYDICVNLNHHN